jgi:hypothetical protein
MGSCEHGNEQLGPVKRWEFAWQAEQLLDYEEWLCSI